MFNEADISLKCMFYLMKDGVHHASWESWEGKPFFHVSFYWYDSPRFCFHLYKFWWSVDYV